jgi:hypothetical protein
LVTDFSGIQRKSASKRFPEHSVGTWEKFVFTTKEGINQPTQQPSEVSVRAQVTIEESV